MEMHMANKTLSKGKCYVCKNKFSKNGIKRHLLKCNNMGEGSTNYFMLKIEGYYNKNYWIYIQVKETALLKDLDTFLRNIWLECCGHLSAFEIDNTSYEDDISEDSFGLFRRNIQDMSKTKLKDVLDIGKVLKHEYDFGSTTTLKITVVEKYSGVSTINKITLLARNNATQYKCEECGKKATEIVMVDELNRYVFLCNNCIDKYDDYSLSILPITNSPRMGVCGYCGENDIDQLD